MRFQPGLLSKAIIAASFAVAFAGCGGGGHHHDDPVTPDPDSDPVTHELSGTAASGAPIIGQVTVKDAAGTLKVVDIEADGHYSVDVSNLVAPFLLRAAGKVGGRNVILLSAATTADLDGTINITPFTDLIVANIAGQVATSYFDSGTFSTLTTDQLNAAKTVLTQRLQPILASMGISDSFDLLRTSFAANRSGFDAVMDVVRVTVDAGTGTAQIRDLINNTVISDVLSNPSDAEALPAPVIPLTGVADDLTAIVAQLAKLHDELSSADALGPDKSSLRALFVDDGSFLDSGEDLDTFLQDVTSDDETHGIQFSGVTILQRIDDATLRVGVTLTRAGSTDSDSTEFVMKKIDGVWKIAGDQRAFDAEVRAINQHSATGAFATGDTSYHRYLQLQTDDSPTDVMYVVVTGPGLHTGEHSGIALHRDTNFDGFSFVNGDGSDGNGGSWLSECGDVPQMPQQQNAPTPPAQPCVKFTEVGLNAEYTFSVRDVNYQEIAGKPSTTVTLPAPPLPNDVAAARAAGLFASFASVTPANYSALTNGTTITVTLTLPTGGNVFDGLQYNSKDTFVDAKHLNSDGTTVDLTWEGPTPTEAPNISVWTSGELDREFVTYGRHNAPTP